MTLSKTRIDDIIESLKDTENFDFCLIVISGDIAYSGKKEEYVIAEKRINYLKDKIEKNFFIKWKSENFTCSEKSRQ